MHIQGDFLKVLATKSVFLQDLKVKPILMHTYLENHIVDNFIWWGQISVLQQILMEMETLFRKAYFDGF